MEKFVYVDYQTLTNQQLLDLYECTVNRQPQSQYVEEFLRNIDGNLALALVPLHVCSEIARRWVNDMNQ